MTVIKHERATKAGSEPTKRLKSRDLHRAGPIPFQFVTATDPSQFKEDGNNRIVRSQATIYSRCYTYGQGKSSQALSGDASGQDKHRPGRASKFSFKMEDESSPLLLNTTIPGKPDDQCQSYTQTLRLWATSSVAQDGTHIQGRASHVYVPSTRSWEVHHGNPVRQEAGDTKYNPENYLDNEEVKMRTLIRHLTRCGGVTDSPDPSDILPRFANLQIDSVYLIRHYLRVFVANPMVEKWLPTVLSDPRLILISTLITSGWLDMHEGYKGESFRTSNVKLEVYVMVGKYLHDGKVALEDASLMAINNLLIGEMWDLNEKHLRIHQKVIADLVRDRGGMRSSKEETIHDISAACSYHADLICDTEPFPIFEAWEPLDTWPDPLISLTESPLFYQNTAQPESGPLIQLICDMRDLGDIFIYHATGMNYTSNTKHKDTTRMSSSSFEFNMQTSEIIGRLVNLPSASEPGHSSTDDWIYESCRIAALIYAAVINLRISFSDAADPARNSLYIESTKSSDGSSYSSNSLSDLLFQALKRTDIDNSWGDLAGVLYSVCVVGAMSARTSAMEQMMSAEYDIWVRRCLSMHASRVLILLVFQHPMAIAATAKRLLKVRQLVTLTRRSIPIASSTD